MTVAIDASAGHSRSQKMVQRARLERPRERVIAGRMVNWRLVARRCVQRTIGRAHLPVIPYSDEKIPCSLKATSKPSLRLNVQPPGAWPPGERRPMPMNAVPYRSRSWKEVRA